MNRLQKNHLKDLKRKDKVFNTLKTGRLKVRKRLEQEYRKKALEEITKKKNVTETTGQGTSESK